MKSIIRKVVGVLFYLAYYSICLFILVPSIFNDLIFVVIIALDMVVFSADALIRPVTDREEVDRPTAIMALLFILHPLIVTLFFYENVLLIAEYLVLLNSTLVAYMGIALYIVGTIIMLTSRVQLGRFGSGTLAIQERHELQTDRIYRYIRHPLYSGGLLGKLGMGIAFRSYIITFLVLVAYFVVFRNRMEIEEQILTSEFGEAYQSYVEQTKRLIPFLY